jgi:hypothetical protein
MGIAARRFFGIGVVHNSWDIVINVHWLWNEVVNVCARFEIAILCCSEWIFFHRTCLCGVCTKMILCRGTPGE